jgi:hypothetical protein
MSEYFNCICAKEVKNTDQYKFSHYRTQRHQKFLNSLTDLEWITLPDDKSTEIINLTKVECECGGKYIGDEYERHLNTLVHHGYLDEIKKEIEKNRRTIKPTSEYKCGCGRIVNNVNEKLHFESEKHLMYVLENINTDKFKKIQKNLYKIRV